MVCSNCADVVELASLILSYEFLCKAVLNIWRLFECEVELNIVLSKRLPTECWCTILSYSSIECLCLCELSNCRNHLIDTLNHWVLLEACNSSNLICKSSSCSWSFSIYAVSDYSLCSSKNALKVTEVSNLTRVCTHLKTELIECAYHVGQVEEVRVLDRNLVDFPLTFTVSLVEAHIITLTVNNLTVVITEWLRISYRTCSKFVSPVHKHYIRSIVYSWLTSLFALGSLSRNLCCKTSLVLVHYECLGNVCRRNNVKVRSLCCLVCNLIAYKTSLGCRRPVLSQTKAKSLECTVSVRNKTVNTRSTYCSNL